MLGCALSRVETHARARHEESCALLAKTRCNALSLPGEHAKPNAQSDRAVDLHTRFLPEGLQATQHIRIQAKAGFAWQ